MFAPKKGMVDMITSLKQTMDETCEMLETEFVQPRTNTGCEAAVIFQLYRCPQFWEVFSCY